MIEDLREDIKIEEFDYQFLLSHLKEYKNPRNKITQFLRNGSIVRVKKGLYIFGEKYRHGPVCIEALANLIYGPSYISLEYALQYYHLIPERVFLVTSMTLKPSKAFQTPIASFSYHHLRLDRYQVGVTYLQTNHYHKVFIATPEKALVDLVGMRKDLGSPKEMREHLLENLRIEEEDLQKLNLGHLYEVVEAYRTPAARALIKAIGR